MCINFTSPLNTEDLTTGDRSKVTDTYVFDRIEIQVGYARTNVIGPRTSFVIASVRSSIH